MASNPYVNKVTYNGTTIIDLTADTVTADKVAQGYTAHLASGQQITGTLTQDYGEYDVDSQTLSSGSQNLVITDAGTTPISVEAITITTNGTTTAPSGTAYSPVTVNVSGGAILDTSDIVTVGSYGFYAWQYNNSHLTGSLSFPELISVGDHGLGSAFNNCTGLTGSVSFPKLTTISDNGFLTIFSGCTGLTGSISFPFLTSIGTDGLSGAFNGCNGITALHFKSSMQSVVEAQTGYSSKFGATNATIYFDL